MAMKDRMPASMKAPTMVRPDSRIEIGAPVAPGATASTASLKSDSAAGSLLVSLGKTWMRAVPSARDPFRASSPAACCVKRDLRAASANPTIAAAWF